MSNNINYASNPEKTKEIRGCMLFFVIAFVVVCVCFFLIPKSMTKPKEVRSEENRVTVNIRTEVLEDALEQKAEEWCNVDVAMMSDMVLESKGTATMWSKILLTDSLAPRMAQLYPHLYEYTVHEDHHSFSMKRVNGWNEDYIVVPAWLVARLIENKILELK